VQLTAQHSGPVPILKQSDEKDMKMISTYDGMETKKNQQNMD
jgi:hypothetical protein